MIMTRVMKGEHITDYSLIRFPVYASPKIDGFRCLVSDIARTSRMKEFPNRHVHESFKGLLPKKVILDGELVVGKRRGDGVLSRTSSGITSRDGTPDWRFWVFDAPRDGLGFKDRLRLAKKLVKELDHPQIRIVKHVLIEDLASLEAYIDWALSHGFEGVMTRTPDGPHKQGKATLNQQYLLKIKPFETHEARISDYFEEMENTNEAKRDATGRIKRSSAKSGKVAKGTLGGFIGTDLKTDITVRVGGGFSADQRKEFWIKRDQLIGKIFTYSKQSVGEKDKPRHPNFVCLRPEWDMSHD